MAAGRACALSVVLLVVVAAPLLLAGVADADCFDYCFKDCIAKDKNMIDYCNYACDKTCYAGAPQRPLAAAAAPGDMGCQLSCARTSCHRLDPDREAAEACSGQCYDGCKTKTLPRPLRAGAGMPTTLGPVLADLPSSEPDPDDAFPSSEPDPDDALPSSEPDPDDAVRASSEAPEHEAMGPRPPFSEIHAAPPASA
ncbi:hypothetical protein CFC21_047315 [Triticum aestivum]|uniref:Acidic protein n=2 Tax=Triticum aestivum TaxID=4565 RepID=A0A9R1FYZ8_WHEAT|nr:uncharacterized protein LOC123074517 [Triticum aestivum]KAF7036767.1 hypothetical protein CFC21_047315 [Triticum aestivum]